MSRWLLRSPHEAMKYLDLAMSKSKMSEIHEQLVKDAVDRVRKRPAQAESCDLSLLAMEYLHEHPDDDLIRISPRWLDRMGGVRRKSRAGLYHWDFVIVSAGDSCGTFLRIHWPIQGGVQDGECVVGLFSDSQNCGIGIAKWPKTRRQFRGLCEALGISTTETH